MPKLLPVVDLFAGVGGLSLGAARAGFDVIAAVEWDSIASSTHHVNFPGTRTLCADVSFFSGEQLRSAAGIGRYEEFGLIGGPPCQGFSSIGKRDPTDPRNTLFAHFFRLVREARPAFFLAENVPGLLDASNAEQLLLAFSLVPDDYTILDPIRVAADDLGVPTVRERVFFIGFRNDISTADISIDADKEHAVPVTVGEALLGLPPIRAGWNTEALSWRRLSFQRDDTYFGRSLIDRVPPTVGDAEAIEVLEEGWVSGCLGTTHDDQTITRFSRLKPGEIDPVYRSKKLHPDGFCPTLRAGTGAEKGSFQAVRPIHFRAPRVITPREAARLQGFPDWYRFHPTKWHAFRQIGNSVSPLVAEVILCRIAERL